MGHRESIRRTARAHGSLSFFSAFAIALVALATGEAHAQDRFVYADEPVHPGCVHALAMQEGDRGPVTTAVSLQGCATSMRTKSKVWYERDLAVIKASPLEGGGTFGYRVLTRLDNGIFALAIRRVREDGEERVSLAAVQLVARPMIRHGSIVPLMQIELLGELWVPDMELASFRSMGNTVHFVSGVGADRVERDFDFTRLGRMRK